MSRSFLRNFFVCERGQFKVVEYEFEDTWYVFQSFGFDLTPCLSGFKASEGVCPTSTN